MFPLFKEGQELLLLETKALQAVNGETYLRKRPLQLLQVPKVRDIVKTFHLRLHAFDMTSADKTRAGQIFGQYKLVAAAPAGLELTRNPAANQAYPCDTPYYFLKAKCEVDGTGPHGDLISPGFYPAAEADLPGKRSGKYVAGEVRDTVESP